ncbi:unnamed protein product [Cylicostephanus goldi]|uniref:Uncharacterized protein n=1 Tax=Cylicostephanus goldi TaxID=71465 RepID=A0A3P6RPM4_CYLGO|nr:unnamed protein product [Cylicostephanus goldi]
MCKAAFSIERIEFPSAYALFGIFKLHCFRYAGALDGGGLKILHVAYDTLHIRYEII